MIISTDQLLYVLCALKLINLLLQSDLDNKSIPSSTTTSTSKPSTADHKPQQNSTQNNVSVVHTLPQHHVNNSINMNSTMEVETDQDLAFLAEMLTETTTGYQPQNFAAVMTTSPSVHNLQYTASPSYYNNPASMQACFCVQSQN